MKPTAAFFALFVILSSLIQAQPFKLDTTFQPDYPFLTGSNNQHIGYITSIWEESNGYITIGGVFRDQTNNKRLNIIRLRDNGTTDIGWYPSQWLDGFSINSIQKVSGTYYCSYGNLGILKMNDSGSILNGGQALPLDTNFSGGTKIPYIFSDGSLLVGGDGGKYPSSDNFQRRLYFMRIKSDGWVDSTFLHNSYGSVLTTTFYDSTHLLLYGNLLSLYDSIAVNKICRIDTAGNLDTTFQTGYFGWGGPIPLYIQDDGKIIVGGQFTIVGSSDTLCVLRLHPNGSIDSSFNNFNSVSGINQTVKAICPTTDGGWLMGGVISTYQGYPRSSIVKTDGNGFIDLQYFNGVGTDSAKNHLNYPPWINKIVKSKHADTYYVMGHFLKYDGQVVKPIIRIHGLSHTVGMEDDCVGAYCNTPLRVYPNPASEEVIFRWDGSRSGHALTLRIRDGQGRMIYQQEIPAFFNQWEWNVHQLPRGMYLYELSSDGKRKLHGKIVVR